MFHNKALAKCKFSISKKPPKFTIIPIFLGITTKSSVDIVIIRPIRIKQSDSDSFPMKIELKKSLKLSCDTMIDPQILDTISIQWFKDDQKLNNNLNKSEIFIDSVDQTDGGIYKCEVKSSLDFLDSVKSTWIVEISQFPKIIPTFPHQLVLLNGQTKGIQCIGKLIHSSEIRGLRSMKCSSETLQNLLYIMYKKTHVVFFCFSFRATLLFAL